MDTNPDPKQRLDALARDYDQWLTDLAPKRESHETRAEKPLEQLLEISGTLHRIHDRAGLMTYVSGRLREFFDAQNSFVILFDEDGAARVLESNLDPASPAELLVSSTVLERVKQSKAPVAVADTSLDPALSGRSSIEQLKIASVLCAPLIVEDRVIGALQFDHRGEIHGFPASDARLLQLFANQVATAVHNLQLIEKRDEALEETRRAEEKLMQSERLSAVGRLAAGVAHDFNNSLFITLGQCDVLLERAGLPDHVEIAIKRIQSCALDAASTVERLQCLGPDATRPPRNETASLVEVANELQELTRRKWDDEARQRGLSLRLEVESRPTPSVRASASELREILTNLIFNAVEAMQSDGTIRIETGIAEGSAFASVRDEGRGMEPEECARIFEPFFSTKAGRGHGFGMSTCWSLVEGLGGSLDVESKPGRGTTITLRLPIAELAEPSSQPPAETGGASLRILAVDDDTVVRETLERMLNSIGHQVVACESAAEALQQVRVGQFDLLVSDIAMPVQNGVDLAMEVSRIAPKLPVVLISGYGVQAGVSLPGNVCSVLRKPIGIRDLAEAVRAMGR